MRWFKKPVPKDGENRIRRRFLWLPLTIDRETRWLEHAVLAEVVVHAYDGGVGWWWKAFRFVDDRILK